MELGEGSFVLKLGDYTEIRISMLEEMCFRWDDFSFQGRSPPALLPIVHECPACSFLAFQRQCFKTEHRIFIVIAFILFPMSQLILLLCETHCLSVSEYAFSFSQGAQGAYEKKLHL